MICLLLCCTLLATSNADIHVGAALNIFNYFGDLGAIIKLSPGHAATWFPDYDSFDVFEELMETISPSIQVQDTDFNGDFNLELCDNISQLKAAFFRHFNIERSEKPWRAFTGSWSNSVLARHLGVNASFLTGPHGYVLVRLIRHHDVVRLTPHVGLRLNNWTAEYAELMVPGDINSVLDFIRVSGSHYVSSYMTGDSLYQVFVFTPSIYDEIQKVVHENNAASLGLDRVLSYFTPWHVEHMGRILSASGNASLELWAAEQLQSRVFMFLYSSLLKIHGTPELLQDLNHLLGNKALLSMELRTLGHHLRVNNKRLWFEEVLDNHIKLWEMNV